MKDIWKQFKLEQAGAADGGTGGTGNGNLLTGTDGGGGTTPGQTPPGGGSGAGGAPTNAGGAGAGAQGGQATDWKAQLPPELQEDKTIGRFNSPADLAAAYRNLQRQFSADKLAIPGKSATEDDWKQVFEKLGVPKEVKDYAVKFKDGVTVEEKFTKEFVENAHKLGILPKQAQALADWFSDMNLGAEGQMREALTKQFNEQLEGLKKDWGQAFEKKIGMANAVFSKLPETVQKSLTEAGLARNTDVVRAMAHLAQEFMGETELADMGSNAGKGRLSPAEAQKEIDRVMADTTGPYHVKDHPGHTAAVAEVQKLFGMLYTQK